MYIEICAEIFISPLTTSAWSVLCCPRLSESWASAEDTTSIAIKRTQESFGYGGDTHILLASARPRTRSAYFVVLSVCMHVGLGVWRLAAADGSRVLLFLLLLLPASSTCILSLIREHGYRKLLRTFTSCGSVGKTDTFRDKNPPKRTYPYRKHVGGTYLYITFLQILQLFGHSPQIAVQIFCLSIFFFPYLSISFSLGASLRM